MECLWDFNVDSSWEFGITLLFDFDTLLVWDSSLELLWDFGLEPLLNLGLESFANLYPKQGFSKMPPVAAANRNCTILLLMPRHSDAATSSVTNCSKYWTD